MNNKENNEIYIGKWFHFYSTNASFKAHLDSGVINPDSICFLRETMQIYTQCSYFGISLKDFEKLSCIVQEHEKTLKNILGVDGPSVGDGVLNNLKDFENFLAGFGENETLKGTLSAIREALEKSIKELRDYIKAVEQKTDTNAANIQLLRMRQDNFEQTLNDYYRQFQEFKSDYNQFYTLVNSRLDNIDNTIHLHQEQITNIYNKVQEESNNKGKPGGSVPLDESGKISSEYLPSYVDDILEFANLNAFPNPGETGKIYVALDTNLIYRWSGTQYTEVSKSLAVGPISTSKLDEILI